MTKKGGGLMKALEVVVQVVTVVGVVGALIFSGCTLREVRTDREMRTKELEVALTANADLAKKQQRFDIRPEVLFTSWDPEVNSISLNRDFHRIVAEQGSDSKRVEIKNFGKGTALNVKLKWTVDMIEPKSALEGRYRLTGNVRLTQTTIGAGEVAAITHLPDFLDRKWVPDFKYAFGNVEITCTDVEGRDYRYTYMYGAEKVESETPNEHVIAFFFHGAWTSPHGLVEPGELRDDGSEE
jgi:hypothetical protein